MDTDEEWGCSEEENWRRFGQNDHCRLYGKRDFIRRLEKVGFYVNELGEGWFGKDFYQKHGFDDLSIMYVATKARQLVKKEESDPKEELLIGLQQENKLLHQVLMNLSDRIMEQKGI